MNGDLGLLAVAAMLLFIGGSGVGHGATALRCSVTRDPVYDAPAIALGIIMLLLGTWIAAQTMLLPAN